MEFDDVEALRARWGHGRRLFRYFKDRYALMLIEYALAAYPSVADLKRSPYRRLLQKPLLRDLLSRLHGAAPSRRDLREAVAGDTQAYRLSLGTWPLKARDLGTSWAQVTRDRWNVVLQLNLDRRHTQHLRQFLSPVDAAHPFDGVHPVAPVPEITIAWVRMDVDPRRREALIEEVQTDWIQHVGFEAEDHDLDDPAAVKWKQYEQGLLKPHLRTWSEAALAAAIELLHREQGISTIYFHTYDAGRYLKNMGESRPPRSLYTDLPRRFCFTKTAEHPRFIVETAKSRQRRGLKRMSREWYRLRLPDSTAGVGGPSVPEWHRTTSSSTGTAPEAAAADPGRWSSTQHPTRPSVDTRRSPSPRQS